MNLSAEILDLIVSRLRLQSPQESDHRRSPRMRLRARILVHSCHDQEIGFPMDVWVRDLSCSGMAVEHEQPLQKGDRVIACLPHMGDKHLLMRCTIVYSRPLPNGRHQLGLRFDQALESLPGKQRVAV